MKSRNIAPRPPPDPSVLADLPPDTPHQQIYPNPMPPSQGHGHGGMPYPQGSVESPRFSEMSYSPHSTPRMSISSNQQAAAPYPQGGGYPNQAAPYQGQGNP